VKQKRTISHVVRFTPREDRALVTGWNRAKRRRHDLRDNLSAFIRELVAIGLSFWDHGRTQSDGVQGSPMAPDDRPGQAAEARTPPASA
jgi:hypothetical protein